MVKSNLHFDGLFPFLEDLAQSANFEVVVISPFMSRAAAARFCRALDLDIAVSVFTRWLPGDLASGASDCEAFLEFQKFPNARFFTNDRLHAKYFRFDDKFVFGSANMTLKALTDSSHSNIELLSEPLNRSEVSMLFEENVLRDAEFISVERFLEFQALQNMLREELGAGAEQDIVSVNKVGDESDFWWPPFRNPDDFFKIYKSDGSEWSPDEMARFRALISRWSVPLGMERNSLELYIRECIKNETVVKDLNLFLASSERRFGEVTSYLSQTWLARSEASVYWQVLLRWLLYFSSGNYSYRRNPHSELVRYLGV